MDLGKLAFQYLGNSSLFRGSGLWQEASPLIYSALFPKKIPPDVDKAVEAKLKKAAEEAQLQSEVDAEVLRITQSDPIIEQALDADPLTEPVKIAEDITTAFNGTAIDYEVFFLA